METQIELFLLSPEGIGLLVLIVAWDLFWKGKGMWISAKNNHLEWFIAILVLNTIGIVPIIYIYFFSKQKNEVVGMEKSMSNGENSNVSETSLE